MPHEEETDCQSVSVSEARAHSPPLLAVRSMQMELSERAQNNILSYIKLVKKASYDLRRTFEYVGGGAGAVFHHELRAQNSDILVYTWYE